MSGDYTVCPYMTSSKFLKKFYDTNFECRETIAVWQTLDFYKTVLHQRRISFYRFLRIFAWKTSFSPISISKTSELKLVCKYLFSIIFFLKAMITGLYPVLSRGFFFS